MRALTFALVMTSAVVASGKVGDELHGPHSAPVEPFRIVGNIHYVGARNIASYLITTSAGHILLDTGTREMVPVVRGSIEIASPRRALLVPRDAIQRAQEHDLVFVRTAPGQFDPVAVQLGARAGSDVEVVRGLAPGVEVVTTGAFVLKTEILKDSIGAGCADD